MNNRKNILLIVLFLIGFPCICVSVVLFNTGFFDKAAPVEYRAGKWMGVFEGQTLEFSIDDSGTNITYQANNSGSLLKGQETFISTKIDNEGNFSINRTGSSARSNLAIVGRFTKDAKTALGLRKKGEKGYDFVATKCPHYSSSMVKNKMNAPIVKQWKERIESVCIKIENLGTDSLKIRIPGHRNELSGQIRGKLESLEEEVRSSLSVLNIYAVNKAEDCDARLEIAIDLKPLKGTYGLFNKEFYHVDTGAVVSGYLRLIAADKAKLEFPIENRIEPPGSIEESEVNKPAPLGTVLFPPVRSALTNIWNELAIVYSTKRKTCLMGGNARQSMEHLALEMFQNPLYGSELRTRAGVYLDKCIMSKALSRTAPTFFKKATDTNILTYAGILMKISSDEGMDAIISRLDSECIAVRHDVLELLKRRKRQIWDIYGKRLRKKLNLISKNEKSSSINTSINTILKDLEGRI